MKKLNVARLDRTITVERSAETLDGYGAPVRTWEEVATIRAEIVKNALEEQFRADYGSEGALSITFRTRFADVRLGDRITYAERQFDVREVQEIGRRQGLEIKAVSRGPQ